MSKETLSETLKEYLKELVLATEERDKYEVEYELEKARMMFSAEVGNLGNQPLREAQVTILLSQNGMFEKMATLRTKGKVAWYKWSSLKSLIDGKETVESF